MSVLISRRSTFASALRVVLLALPAIAVNVWLVSMFPSYLGARFFGDVAFALAWCGLLTLISRWRVLGSLSWPIATLLYVTWLLLVFSEAVSYYLQADTFNGRFFANLSPENLDTGLHAFPLMIGGGLLALCALLLFAAWTFRAARSGQTATMLTKAGALLGLVIVAFGVDSTPRRLAHYFVHYEHALGYADSAAGKAVLRQINPNPTTRQELVAAPGRNLVILYMESLERMYADPKAFPALTPNLDRLRAQGLDFSGFETFSGATFTIAGMFASQCGTPLFSSPFSAFDYAAGNNNDSTTFQPKLVCLGDVLHAAGYRQIYLGGAPIQFSGKGTFYRLHGYDQALGLQELESEAQGSLPQSGWGLYDADLFRLALDKYRGLEKTGEPFNLAMITLDTHPPDGRPSPGCPRYDASDNPMLQAVHCTDHLVGRFVEQLSHEPAFKDTVVVVMSDHLAMRNDSEPLYPKGYHRQPLMFVLNAGHGERTMRFYHMDIAPTLLGLMGVRTNASFIAGADRSAAAAPGNPLVDSEVTDSVLRRALWSKASEFRLCKKNTLLAWTGDDGFQIGGREMKMAEFGEPAMALKNSEVLTFLIDKANTSSLLTPEGGLAKVLKQRGAASALLIRPHIADDYQSASFSVDWLSRRGALTHIADVPRLRGLRITSPDCNGLIEQAEAAAPTARLDYSGKFQTTVAEILTLQPGTTVEFRKNLPDQLQADGGRPYKVAIGWFPAASWGSWTWGDYAELDFKLPPALCRGGRLHFTVHPFLPASRPALDVVVMDNRREATTWHFAASGPPQQELTLPVSGDGKACETTLGFRFIRPDPPPKHIPADEDPRDLQLDFINMSLSEPTTEH